MRPRIEVKARLGGGWLVGVYGKSIFLEPMVNGKRFFRIVNTMGQLKKCLEQAAKFRKKLLSQ